MNKHLHFFKLLLLSIFLLMIGCASDSMPIEALNSSLKKNALEQLKPMPFQIKIYIEKQSKNNYELVVTIDLDSGSYFVSPYS